MLDERTAELSPIEETRARSAELFADLLRNRTTAARRTELRDDLVRLHLPSRRAPRATVPEPWRAVRRPAPGRHDRADQGDRPFRPGPRRRVLDVRHSHHRR